MQTRLIRAVFITGILLLTIPASYRTAVADMSAVQKWIETEFRPSTLSKEAQHKELVWIMEAAKPFKKMEIKVVSEIIPTHRYESETLTRAFHEITGIKVTHVLVGEDELMEKLDRQLKGGKSDYDAWVCDADMIGTLVRNSRVVSLSEFMLKEGKDVTLPTLELDDFMGKFFVMGPDDNLYQLPDQQCANLYWFRYDWFNWDKFKKEFKEKYDYDLGVPINWSAYEDIADFFTNHVQAIKKKNVYGHSDYGKTASQLARRFSDAWLSMAGVGDKGIPNGKPVDEWGIRVEGCRPVGATVVRGGAANSPAAKYALRKYLEWNAKYAPSGSLEMDRYQNTKLLARGEVAQQIFFYTATISDFLLPGPTVDRMGRPKWRVAPSPRGAYWESGMKQGYQDCGAWTFFKETPIERRKAAWLYAQFCVAKSISLKKTHVGLAPIRISDIQHESFTQRAPYLGGLVEFYRSPARAAWTPNGLNVPDYQQIFKLWEKNIGHSVAGKISAGLAMDQLAADIDKVLLQLSAAAPQIQCAPKLNPIKDANYWLIRPGSPKAKVNEKQQGETVDYDSLLQSWQRGLGR